MKKSMGLLFIVLMLSISACQLEKYGAYDNADKYKILDSNGETYNLSLKNIDLSWVKGSVNIIQTDEYKGTTVKEYTNEVNDEDYLCHVLREEDFLNIKYCASNVSIPKEIFKDLTIYVPSDIAIENLIISGVSNSLNINSITCQNLRIENVDGKVNINNVNVKTINYEGVSGDLSVILNHTTQELRIDQVSGSTIVSLPEDIGGFVAYFDSVDGGFTNEFATTLEDDKYTYDNGNAFQLLIDFDSVDGNLYICKHDL